MVRSPKLENQNLISSLPAVDETGFDQAENDVDLAEYVTVKEELKRQIAINKQLIGSVHDGLVIYDVGLHCHLWSPMMEKLTGVKSEQLVGKSTQEASFFPEKTGVLNRLNRVLKGSVVEEGEFFLGEGQNRVWLADRNVPMLNQGGQIIGVMSAIKDLTAQKRLETALAESVEQKLQKDIILASLGHDINNSMQAVLGIADLVLFHSEVDERTKESINMIKVAGKDASVKVDKLRSLAKGQFILDDFKEIKFNDILDEVIHQAIPIMLDRSVNNKNRIQLKTNLKSGPSIIGNESELRSAFLNLIKNSIEAMPNGGVIEVKTICDDKEIRILIEDQGIGMTEEVAAKVFHPFFSTKQDSGERGVGMYSVKKTIKAHGGNIKLLRTAPGNGTVFEIRLPIKS